jgi:hypothetical protein
MHWLFIHYMHSNSLVFNVLNSLLAMVQVIMGIIEAGHVDEQCGCSNVR